MTREEIKSLAEDAARTLVHGELDGMVHWKIDLVNQFNLVLDLIAGSGPPAAQSPSGVQD